MIGIKMNEQNEIPPKRNYKWPWFALAAVVLFLVLAIVWMSYAVHREKQERNFNAPIPNSSG
jgi:NADH:ubiquinone oxidoreductase subunit 6 (subunit J)